ncbi:hypothetical protein [Salmonella enterica]
MGWLVMAVGLTILIITGSYQNQKMSETTTPSNMQVRLYGQVRY